MITASRDLYLQGLNNMLISLQSARSLLECTLLNQMVQRLLVQIKSSTSLMSSIVRVERISRRYSRTWREYTWCRSMGRTALSSHRISQLPCRILRRDLMANGAHYQLLHLAATTSCLHSCQINTIRTSWAERTLQQTIKVSLTSETQVLNHQQTFRNNSKDFPSRSTSAKAQSPRIPINMQSASMKEKRAMIVSEHVQATL